MNDTIYEKKTIHISELDDFLASSLVDSETTPLIFSVSKYDSQGYITIGQGKATGSMREGGIDFELSPSEYQSLDSIEIEDFTKQTIYTSSAYEFFDFILMYFSYLECILDFTGGSWRINILKYKKSET
jgi:hypothetical protein